MSVGELGDAVRGIIGAKAEPHRIAKDSAEQAHRPRCRPLAASDDGAPVLFGLHVSGGLAVGDVTQETFDVPTRDVTHQLLAEEGLDMTFDPAAIRDQRRGLLHGASPADDGTLFGLAQIIVTEIGDLLRGLRLRLGRGGVFAGMNLGENILRQRAGLFRCQCGTLAERHPALGGAPPAGPGAILHNPGHDAGRFDLQAKALEIGVEPEGAAAVRLDRVHRSFG